ncbi:hypothetical protein F4782DRAFT_544703 [Xylaria castorea]|nr:hypothetical protein F4782DRAFT_544703 [Xylaria castorea]
MNDTSIVNFLVDEFQCHICFDLLENPRPACTWGHIFCRKCLEQLIRQNAIDGRFTRCPICRVEFRPTAIEHRILGDNESSRRTSRILQQLRQRVVRPPPRDIGLQTDLSSTRSTGQQTDNPLPRDNERGTNAALSEKPVEAITPQEDAELSSGAELPDNQPGGTQEIVVDRRQDIWQGMVALRRYHEEYANRRMRPRVNVERIDEEQETESDPGTDKEDEKLTILDRWIPLGSWMRGLGKQMPRLSTCIFVLVGLRILGYGLSAD